MAEIAEKVPVEDKWAFASNVFSGSAVGLIAQLVGALGKEKVIEILNGMWGGGGKTLHPMIQQKYNIPVEDAAGAAKLSLVVGKVALGPEYTSEIVESTPERAVRRTYKCALWERAKEYNLLDAFEVCGEPCATFVEEGFKAVNPKIAFELTKCPEWGDEYCEFLYEFKK